MKETAYWIALAHLPRWGYQKINSLIVKFFHENKITIEDFFQLEEKDWRKDYHLDEKQVLDLATAKSGIAGNAFLAESYINQGYEIIPVTAEAYSNKLKANLKATHSPAVLYVKGNKELLDHDSIAIAGSRDASEVSLTFTDNITKIACSNSKVIVSGFAKGVDKQALDSSIKYNGQSIIVLPQGIMTFGTGFKNYYKQIVNGDVLVLSTSFPTAPWKSELAMARNPIIYGLADEIFIAESSDQGGTWSGAIDGLRKGRKIFVRKPGDDEKNANELLIQKGATPVDFDGNVLPVNNELESTGLSTTEKNVSDISEIKLRSAFNGRPLQAKELLSVLELDWSIQRLKSYLKKLAFIEIIKDKKTNYYKLRSKEESTQSQLFV